MRIIAGRWKGHPLQSVKGSKVRPTTDRVREAWMAALGPGLDGARVVDLFSGSGALGLEALSRGASEVVFVERARSALAAIRANIARLGAEEECRVIQAEVFSFLRRERERTFDLALADPPYDRGLAQKLFELFVQSEFARELWVEHRSAEAMPPFPRLRQRRYGDTTISILTGNE
jgi:16S rRNA (guanine966-N2)-methyltransferase